MTRHRADESPDRSNTDPLTSTGSHRAVSGGRRRGLARWPIVTAGLVVLLILGWAGWNWGQSVASNRAGARESACPEGTTTLRVIVPPGIENPVAAAAKTWNAADSVVHGHCVRTIVDAIPSEQVVRALSGETPLASIGGLPAAWAPESQRRLGQLRDTDPALLGTSAESIATTGAADYPYVGLAGDGVTDVQARAAQTFRAYLLREPQRAAFTEAGFGPPNRAS